MAKTTQPKKVTREEEAPKLTTIQIVVLTVVILIVVLVILGSYAPSDRSQNFPSTSTPELQSTTANQEPKQTQPQKSLPEIVKEWRKDTALILCNSGLGYAFGSGLLVNINGKPQVITNGHVVTHDPICWIKFPDQTGTSTYAINGHDITYDSNGYDVAYIDMSSYSQSDFYAKEALYSISERARKDSYLCKNNLSVGDSILILGYPVYGTPISWERFFSSNPIEVTATEGIVSGMDGIYYTTSAKIDHGNSGGLAIDETNDCYFGIPTWDVSGGFESLGRILPASIFLHY